MFYDVAQTIISYFDVVGLVGFTSKLFTTVFQVLPGIFLTFVSFLCVILIIRIALKLL